MTGVPLLDWTPPSSRFDGAVFEHKHDAIRLTGQIKRVHDVMIDGRWRTLSEVEAATRDPQASISAQLRNLRKDRFGLFVVAKRTRGDRSSGLYEYKLSRPVT